MLVIYYGKLLRIKNNEGRVNEGSTLLNKSSNATEINCIMRTSDVS